MRATRTCAAAVLLVGPAALGFASGGYFGEARLWAALVACLLAAAGALVAPRPLPRSTPGRIAIAGLAGLLVWTLVSRSWAPVVGAANADAQRLALYLAVLVAAVALLRGAAARWAEPVLGAGVVVVVGYGLTERLLPGVVELDHVRAAMGRLAQPLTYWNAMGALAALGLVLAARLAGDVARRLPMRTAAGCAAAPLGAGLVLAFSRGAIAAALIGLVVLWALFPSAAQLRAVVVVALAAGAAGAVAALLPGVRRVEGELGERELGGLLLAVALLAAAAAAGVAVARAARMPDSGRRRLRPAVAVVGVAVALGLVLAAAALEGDTRSTDGATAARLGSAESNRYAYWRVAVDTFAEAPLRGHGSGSFGVLWLRDRTVPEAVRDAHSLELETAAELGLVGLVLLSLLLGGVAGSTVLALRRDAAAAAGPAAVLAAWAAHSAVDWDWEMPALTLVAVLLAGLLIARADSD